MRTYDTIGNLTTNKEGYAIRRCAVFNDRFGNTIHEITSYGKTEEPVYDKNIRAHKWTYTFNAQGQLIQEEYYNTSNKLINNWLGYSKAIYTYDSKGRLVTRSFYNSNGKNTSVMNRIDYNKLNGKNIIGGYAKDSIAYISNNKQMRFLFNSTGEIDDCDFCSAIELREQRGDTLISINYDRNYNKTSKYGWAIGVAIFDDRNFPIDVLYFNEDSIRMPYGNTGISRMKNIFDGKGNRIECRFYDCADNLLSPADGAPILCFEYDERNNEIKRYTKDNFEKPYNRDNYGFGIRQIYDKLDRIKEEITIDTIGRPYMLPSLQYAIKKLKYDNFGNVIEESYYDEYDIPTHCAQGYHKVKMLYDDYQNRTGFGYFDTIGNAISINGSHCQTNLYNNYQLSESSYFDEDSSYVGKIQYVYNHLGDVDYQVRYLPNLSSQKEYIRPCIYENNEANIVVQWGDWNITQPVDNYLTTQIQLRNEQEKDILVFSLNKKKITSKVITNATIIQSIYIPDIEYKGIVRCYIDTLP
jgi:hypothetical protein